MPIDEQEHWDALYRTRPASTLSWFESEPAASLELLERAGLNRESSVIDVGGGASALVDRVLARGVGAITVLDLSRAALAASRARLGDAAHSVTWCEDNVLSARLAVAAYDLWHDRAVFHFLATAEQREQYVAQLARSLRPHGSAIIAAFAEDGPTRCSGLDVVRYGPDELSSALGSGFELREVLRKTHITPAGVPQSFIYSRWSRSS
jgi:SAM-dependent methyltransferase